MQAKPSSDTKCTAPHRTLWSTSKNAMTSANPIVLSSSPQSHASRMIHRPDTPERLRPISAASASVGLSNSRRCASRYESKVRRSASAYSWYLRAQQHRSHWQLTRSQRNRNATNISQIGAVQPSLRWIGQLGADCSGLGTACRTRFRKCLYASERVHQPSSSKAISDSGILLSSSALGRVSVCRCDAAFIAPIRCSN